MTARIEIASQVPDTRAAVRTNYLRTLDLGHTFSHIQIVDVYTIQKSLTLAQCAKITDMLTNPVAQVSHLRFPTTQTNPLPLRPFSWAIEVGFLPGVTDNVGTTTKQMIEDLLALSFSSDEGVYTSQITFLSGRFSPVSVETIAQALANTLIQRIHIKPASAFHHDHGMDFIVPTVTLPTTPRVQTVNLNVPEEELLRISKQGISSPDGTRRGPLALDMIYMKAIQQYFRKQNRSPTDIELESLAQTWSEHCKHTIFADPVDDIPHGMYKTYIQGATKKIRQQKGKQDICISVFSDNAGAIAFDRQYLVTDKVETHNSPSALDPFGGAVTGIGGVNRDAMGFGLGAKPVANRYGFCFASPLDLTTMLFRDQKLTQPLFSPRRIMDGVIAGVNAGGNQAGIPTLDGFLYFDSRYQGKPLVFVGTIGLIPRRVQGKPSYQKKARPGDYIVMVGGKVGADGIHGATFSSTVLDTHSPATAVQIGDPITQKKMSDALIKEIRDLGLYTSITDNGAGGLSCSVAEMAKESGGCIVDLDTVPLKYPGMEPWQIWISESQERMTLSVPKKNWARLSRLLIQRDVEATVIGTFTRSGRCIVRYQKQEIMNLDLSFLHAGLPPRTMRTHPPHRTISLDSPSEPKDLNQILSNLLARPTLAHFAYISDQFDHTVQGGAVLGPLQGRGRVNAQATVFRPVLSSPKGVILTHELYPAYSDYDTYHMAACSIDGAVRAMVAAGANPDGIAILDNFCWCSANEPERLYELKRAAEACYDTAVAYGTPFIAGKDSMFNDFHGYTEKGQPITISIPPTLLISALSVITDHTKCISLDSKMPGDLIYLLGATQQELGGSEYYRMIMDQEEKPILRGTVPRVDTAMNKKVYRALFQAINSRLIASAISIGHGGLAVALAKKAIGGMLGMDITMTSELRSDHFLFSESQGRILITIAPEKKNAFEKIMKNSLFTCIGTVRKDTKFTITFKKKVIIETTSEQLRQAYQKTFTGY